MKMQSSKKIDLYVDFAAGVYLYEAQNPMPPSLTHCKSVQYAYSHREAGEGGKVKPERRLEGHNSQSWVKNTNMTCISSL